MVVHNVNLDVASAAMSPLDLAVAHSRKTAKPLRRAPHLNLINEALLFVERGLIKRLGVFVPPRYGKSELVSKYFPAHYLGKHPDNRIILTTHESTLASQWGGHVRDILTELGPTHFGVGINETSHAKDDWRIKEREGGMRTAGVGGSITGRGANVFVLDDAVKNHEEAFSPKIQERNWNWWQTTALSRLEPDGSVVYIQTRWHEEDLAGKALSSAIGEEEQEPWIVIKFSELAEQDDEPPIAIAGNKADVHPEVLRWIKRRNKDRRYLRKKGEVLWPWRWPKKAVLKRKAQNSAYNWQALHQQNPLSAGGLIFKRDYFTIISQSPVDAVRCRFWDCAGTAKAGDWTVGALLSYEPEADLYYLEDIVRGQWSPAEVKKTIRKVAERDGTNTMIRIEQEPGSSGKMFIDEMQRALSAYSFKGIRATGRKELRWDAMTAALQHQRLVLVAGDWNREFIHELELLPAGKHDDQADAAAGAYNALLEKDRAHTPQLTIL